jgi:hypothetical protein
MQCELVIHDDLHSYPGVTLPYDISAQGAKPAMNIRQNWEELAGCRPGETQSNTAASELECVILPHGKLTSSTYLRKFDASANKPVSAKPSVLCYPGPALRQIVAMFPFWHAHTIL